MEYFVACFRDADNLFDKYFIILQAGPGNKTSIKTIFFIPCLENSEENSSVINPMSEVEFVHLFSYPHSI